MAMNAAEERKLVADVATTAAHLERVDEKLDALIEMHRDAASERKEMREQVANIERTVGVMLPQAVANAAEAKNRAAELEPRLHDLEAREGIREVARIPFRVETLESEFGKLRETVDDILDQKLDARVHTVEGFQAGIEEERSRRAWLGRKAVWIGSLITGIVTFLATLWAASEGWIRFFLHNGQPPAPPPP